MLPYQPELLPQPHLGPRTCAEQTGRRFTEMHVVFVTAASNVVLAGVGPSYKDRGRNAMQLILETALTRTHYVDTNSSCYQLALADSGCPSAGQEAIDIDQLINRPRLCFSPARVADVAGQWHPLLTLETVSSGASDMSDKQESTLSSSVRNEWGSDGFLREPKDGRAYNLGTILFHPFCQHCLVQ